MKKVAIVLALILSTSALVVGCRDNKKTPDEHIENAINDVEDDVENASDDVQDAIEDVKDEIEEAKEEAEK